VTKLTLASSSPRRVEILNDLGVAFHTEGADIDETPRDGESAVDLVTRLAESKAREVARRYDGPVMGADTIVVLGQEIFGKPQSMQDGLRMLMALSARTHKVMTAVALVGGDSCETKLSSTDVTFRTIEEDEARAYWHSGEPQDKAGAYAIQGLGGVFVTSINGSYSGVVGLPVFETSALLEHAGITLLGSKEKGRA
jgi:septum formation protein